MPLDIIVVAFILIVTYALIFFGIGIGVTFSERLGTLFVFLGTLAGIVFTAFLISSDGLITTSSVYNINTASWIHNTTPAYPYFVIGFALIDLFNVILCIEILTSGTESSADDSIH